MIFRNAAAMLLQWIVQYRWYKLFLGIFGMQFARSAIRCLVTPASNNRAVCIDFKEVLTEVASINDNYDEIWGKIRMHLVQAGDLLPRDPDVKCVLIKWYHPFLGMFVMNESMARSFHDTIDKLVSSGKDVYIHTGLCGIHRLSDWGAISPATKVYSFSANGFGFAMNGKRGAVRAMRGFDELHGREVFAFRSKDTPAKDYYGVLADYLPSEGAVKRLIARISQQDQRHLEMMSRGFGIAESLLCRLKGSEISAELLLRLGVIELGDVDVLEKQIENKWGLVSYKEYRRAIEPEKFPGVAVVSIRGPAQPKSGSGGDGLNIDFMQKAVRAAAKDPRIKVILVDLDGPGGMSIVGAVLSDLLLYAKREGKKVVVYAGDDLCASAHYMIACVADYIFASDTCLVGSIGVVGSYMYTDRLMDKLGLRTTRFSNSQIAQKTMSLLEGRQAQDLVERAYRDFYSMVARYRKMDPDHVKKIATGEVYPASTALKIGLIDQIGSMSDALEHCRKLAGSRGVVYCAPRLPMISLRQLIWYLFLSDFLNKQESIEDTESRGIYDVVLSDDNRETLLRFTM